MIPTSPRLFRFAEPSSTGRPPSRASSTTEVPGRNSITRDLDKLKSLIAQYTTTKSSGTISAQVFRRQDNVTQAQLFNEVDALKRRLRLEVKPVHVRNEEDDPETESELESDEDEIFDEHGARLDTARMETIRVSQQRERWIEEAERRVDHLSQEKEQLEKQLHQCKTDSKSAHDRIEELAREQKTGTATIAQLKADNAKQFKLTRDTHIKNVERERDLAQKNLEDKDGYIETLEADVLELKRDLAESQESAAEKLRSWTSQMHDLKTQSSSQKQELEERHAKSLQDAQLSASQELARARREAVQAAEDHQQARETALREQSQNHREQTIELRAENAQELKKMKLDHINELDKERSHAADLLDKARARYEGQLRERAEEHTQAIAALTKSHDKSLSDLEKKHEEDQRTLRIDMERKCQDLRNEHGDSIEQINKTHEDRVNELRESADSKFENERQAHSKELQRLREERELALKSASEGAEDKSHLISELDQRHDKERQDWQEKLNVLEREYDNRVKTVQDDMTSTVKELETKRQNDIDDLTRQLQALADGHQDTITKTKQEQDNHKSTMLADHAKSIEELKSKHTLEISEMQNSHKTRLDEAQIKIGEALDQAEFRCCALKEQHIANLAELHTSHDEDIAVASQAHHAEIKKLKSTHLEALDDASRTNLDVVSSLQVKHNQVLSKMQSEIDRISTHLAESKAQESRTQTQCNDYAKQISQLQIQFSAAQETSREAAEKSNQTMQQQHDERLRSLQEEWTCKATLVASEHKSALGRAIEEATRNATSANDERRIAMQQSLQEAADKIRKCNDELESVKSGHTSEIGQLRAALKEAQDQLASSKKDYEGLQALHASEVGRLLELRSSRSDSGKHLEGLQESSQSIDSAAQPDQNAENETLKQELQNTQAMLQEKLQTSIQAQEEKRQMERKQAVLEQELSSLKQEHSRTVDSLKELQETVIEHQTLSSNESNTLLTDLEELKNQIDLAQQERSAVQSDIDSKSSERRELAAQNDFLTRQITELAQTPRPAKSKYTSRGMQTQSRIEVVGGSPRHRRNISLSTDQDPSRSPTARSNRNSIIFGPELPGSPLVKSVTNDRPVTPISSLKADAELKASPDVKARRRTFQDYTKSVENQLFELGSVVTAHEAMFAQKISEHVGDLQTAKNRLAEEYRSKFDDLVAEKTRLDKQEMLDNAAEFVRERELLANKYLKEEQTGVTTANATDTIRQAEQSLVRRYNKRLAQRKSQIRLRHSQAFHDLTVQYDQKLAGLLWNESDQELDKLATKPRPNLQKKESLSRLPQRSVTNPARSSTSTSARPQVTRKSSSDGRPSSAISNGSRKISPAEGTATRRSVTSPVFSEDPDQGFSGDISAYDLHGKSLKRQSGSSNMKATTDAGSSADLKRDKSKRLSSGLIYGKLRKEK